MKHVVVVVELLFIGLAFLYVILMVGFRFLPHEHTLQSRLRPVLAQSNFLRTVYGLTGVGDRRYYYAQVDQLEVVLAVLEGVEIDGETETYIRQMILETVEAAPTITHVSLLVEPLEAFTAGEIDSLVAECEECKSSDLVVFYLTQSIETPTYIGEAINDRTILMYQWTVNELSERVQVRQRLAQSTLMHEWGHLLGVEHMEKENCVMSSVVEVYGERRYQGSNIPIQYCPETILEIGKL